jgi:hypothetical protein
VRHVDDSEFGYSRHRAPAGDARAVRDDDPAEAVVVGPTEQEISAWAERERKRREAWVAGPTDEEKRLWAQREQRRRLRAVRSSAEPRESDPLDWMDRRGRDLELTLEGLGVLMTTWPFQLVDAVMQLGRDAERRVGRSSRMFRRSERDDPEEDW